MTVLSQTTELCLSFFYSYGAHRDLHSFPTRRSSDLSNPAADGRHPSPHSTRAEPPPHTQKANESSLDTPRDRKSTRLNSSHSQISYAVFCLKKKNRKY